MASIMSSVSSISKRLGWCLPSILPSRYSLTTATYSAVITLVGKAKTAMPTSAETAVMARPISVVGTISPNPIVDSDMIAQYKASRKFGKRLVSSLNMMVATIKI